MHVHCVVYTMNINCIVHWQLKQNNETIECLNSIQDETVSLFFLKTGTQGSTKDFMKVHVIKTLKATDNMYINTAVLMYYILCICIHAKKIIHNSCYLLQLKLYHNYNCFAIVFQMQKNTYNKKQMTVVLVDRKQTRQHCARLYGDKTHIVHSIS